MKKELDQSSEGSNIENPMLASAILGANSAEFENTIQRERTPRPDIWKDVPDEKWDSWKWQLANRVSSVQEISEFINLTPEEIDGLSATNFKVDITPYFASLIDPNDPRCPIRKQVIPLGRELKPYTGMKTDNLGELKHSPVHGITHRYPDRVLMLITSHCASYCRYCTRKEKVGKEEYMFSKKQIDTQIAYIASNPQIRDTLISGGDALTQGHDRLQYVLEELGKIPHLDMVRIGTRVPIFLPQRITPELCEMFKKVRRKKPLWINTHVNHYDELTPEVGEALNMLAETGIPLGNQAVLLAGVNDSVNIQRRLAHELVKMNVNYRYLYHCDYVHGAGHFMTSIEKGEEIMEGLIGHTSGYAVPRYVIDGEGGKVPIMPNYVLSRSDKKVVVRNFEGAIFTHHQPDDYDPTEIEYLDSLAGERHEPGQEGVHGLLAGKRDAIYPIGFDEAHDRHKQIEVYSSRKTT